MAGRSDADAYYGAVMFEWNDQWLATYAEPVIEPELEIIDPHHHLWAEGPARIRYLLEDLHADTSAGHNVVGTVFMECMFGYRTDGPEAMRPVGESETVAAYAEQSASSGVQILGIVGFADMMLGDAVDDVLAAHEAAGRGPFRGIRHATAFDPDTRTRPTHTRPTDAMMSDATFVDGVRRLGARGRSFDAWLYHRQIPELTALARAVPECTFVLDHLGGPLGIGPYEGKRDEVLATWRGDIAELASCENVIVKVGGIGMVIYGVGYEHRQLPPSSDDLVADWGGPMLYTIEQFGADRCMFESNFPVDKESFSYATMWNAYKKIAAAATEDEKASLFRETAKRVYRLA